VDGKGVAEDMASDTLGDHRFADSGITRVLLFPLRYTADPHAVAANISLTLTIPDSLLFKHAEAMFYQSIQEEDNHEGIYHFIVCNFFPGTIFFDDSFCH
jgi:hypothetical protein